MPNKHTSYRVLNRNGKVIYFENKKTPLYNNNIDNEEMRRITEVTNKAKQTSNRGIQQQRIREDLVLDSSAYTLKSVVDTMVKDDDIENLAKTINKNRQTKTIRDFDNIPESYFNSNIPTEEDLKKNKQLIEENKKKDGLFSKIKGFFKKEDKNPEDDFIKYELANDTGETKNSSSLTVKSDNVDVKEGKIYYKSPNKATTTKTYVKSSTGATTTKTFIKPSTEATTKTYVKPSTEATTKTYVKSSQPNKQSNSSGIYYIQLGSFKSEDNADKLLKKFNNVGTEQKVIPVNTKNGTMYKAVIGNFNTKEEAEKEMEKVLNKGHFDCYVIKM